MSKRVQLVSQHLENISRDALEKCQEIVHRYVRNRQGIYALYRHDKLYYVGLASDLRTRLGQHLRDRHAESWDRFSVYLTIGDAHLRELESLILRIIKTPGNKQKGKFARSEDLRKDFGRAVHEKMRRDYDGMLGKPKKKDAIRLAQPRTKPDGKRNVLADYSLGSIELRARFKGKPIIAKVRRNGSIHLEGRLFHSPSMAATFACRLSKKNGWTFWKYERAPGDWVLLDTLRK